MGYIEQQLFPDEQIVARAKISPAAYLSAVSLLIVGLVTAILIIGVVAIVYAVKQILWLRSVEIAITNRRVIGKSGVLSIKSLNLRLSQLETVSVDQTLVGRVLNYGTLVLTGTGQTRVSIPGVQSPEAMKQEFLRAAHAASSHPTNPGTGPASPLFEVQILDRSNGAETWIEVRAQNETEARQKAASAGAIVGTCRLVRID